MAAWCHENDKTLINGSKIYTGSITADKLKVNSLKAIAATVGGFTIGDDGLYSGTSSIDSSLEGVFVGIDGIKTVDDNGSTIMQGYITEYHWSDNPNYTYINAGGLSLRSKTTNGSWRSQGIHIYKDDVEKIKIEYDGIFNPQAVTQYPIIGFVDDSNITDLGQNTRIRGNLYMADKGYIGTKAYPTGSHVMANNKFLYGLNTSGTSEKLIGLSDGDNMVIGSTEGSKGNIFTYIGEGSSYSVNDAAGYIFGTFIAEDGIRAFKCVPVNDRTTTGGTAVRVGTNGILAKYTSSSMRYKEEITQKLDDALNPERLYDLGVYQYKYRDGHISKNDQRYGMTHIGFIAEDVKHKYPIAANYNDDGQVEDWSERYMIPAMLKLIQNQHKEIQNLKAILEKGKDNENNQSGNS